MFTIPFYICVHIIPVYYTHSKVTRKSYLIETAHIFYVTMDPLILGAFTIS